MVVPLEQLALTGELPAVDELEDALLADSELVGGLAFGHQRGHLDVLDAPMEFLRGEHFEGVDLVAGRRTGASLPERGEGD